MNPVFFYIPNIIGYGRVILAILSFYFINDPTLFLSLYSASCILDAFDGYAARLLSQSSRFGAVLDMVTDRATTAGLICYLTTLYEGGRLGLQISLGLDIASHYMQMYASLSSGSDTHKVGGKGSGGIISRLMGLYYNSRIVLFIACAGNEAFFIALYILAKSSSETSKWWLSVTLWNWILRISLPIWMFKQTMNIVQLCDASALLANIDRKLALKGGKRK